MILTLAEKTKKIIVGEMYHVILLIGSPIIKEKRNIMRTQEGKEGDLCTIYDSAQPCITYSTMEDYLADNGTYFEDVPECEKENLFEYTAKII